MQNRPPWVQFWEGGCEEMRVVRNQQLDVKRERVDGLGKFGCTLKI